MSRYSSSVAKWEPSLPVPEDAHLKEHHVKGQDGKTIGFRNPHPSAGTWQDISTPQVFLEALRGRLRGKLILADPTKARIPTVKPAFPPRGDDGTPPTTIRATWLGHACHFVEMPSGATVLFDPVFEDRCSPSQWVGPKRFTAPACKPADLPAVDAVVISHSHFDHLSETSVRDIASAHPGAQFFVGLGLGALFRGLGISRVTEMDWWEDAALELVREEPPATAENTGKIKARAAQRITARISCLPSQHASGRGMLDKDRTLWASWAVASGGKSVWFGGDTGYRSVPDLPDGVDDYGPDYEGLPRCPQFAQIGHLRGPFDLGLIPIGAYKPRYMFSGWHANPYDSVEIFRDTACKRAVGIHWGTWALTAEDVEEPPKMLREALKKAGIEATGVFEVCAIGESREF